MTVDGGLLQTLVDYWGSLNADQHSLVEIKHLQPPRGGRPLGRLLVVAEKRMVDARIVTVCFEEYNQQ